MVKLIAVDLDGTFFHEKGKLSPANIEALDLARRQGIKTVISTGRVFATCDPIIQSFAQAVDCISTCNGAAVYYPGNPQALHRDGFPPQQAAQLIDFLEQEQIFYRCYANGCIYYSKAAMKTVEQYKGYLTTIEGYEGSTFIEEDLGAWVLGNQVSPEKFFLIFPSVEKASEIRGRLPHPQRYFITSSQANNIELTRQGVNKGSALAFLGRFWGIDPCEMMAIGDSENDLAMLEYVGESVAMGNALPQVKKQCKYVTDTNVEDGVAKIIRAKALAPCGIPDRDRENRPVNAPRKEREGSL